MERVTEHIDFIFPVQRKFPCLGNIALCALGGQQIDTVKKRCRLFLVHTVEHMVAAALGTCHLVGKRLCRLEKGCTCLDCSIYFIEVNNKHMKVVKLRIFQIQANAHTGF